MPFSVVGVLALLLMLIFHTPVTRGAANGLLLWYRTLVPTLLPFILITNALSEINAYRTISHKLHPILQHRTFDIIAIGIGNLCGYPIGGKILDDFVSKKYMDTRHANRLLPYCVSLSPMFLIGYVYTNIISGSIPFFLFLTAIYLPVITGYLLLSENKNGGRHLSEHDTANTSVRLNHTFTQAVQTMVIIGIYVMLFSILLEIILPYAGHTGVRLLLSSLEITNGLQIIISENVNRNLFIPLVGALCSFGGFCSVFQVKCVFESMDIKNYLRTKLLLSAGTALILFLYLCINS